MGRILRVKKVQMGRLIDSFSSSSKSCYRIEPKGYWVVCSWFAHQVEKLLLALFFWFLIHFAGSYRPWLEHTQSISYLDSGNRPATHVVYQGIGTGGHAHHIPEREPPQASSAEGEGHWVLLSSTKGYSVPHRQRSSSGRSLDLDEEKSPKATEKKEEKRERPLSARRSIRLTVLPPLNGAGGTKTSHNGLIEVENSDQTVEEAHREHFARMMKFGNSTDKNEVLVFVF